LLAGAEALDGFGVVVRAFLGAGKFGADGEICAVAGHEFFGARETVRVDGLAEVGDFFGWVQTCARVAGMPEPDSKLREFVEASKEKGASDEFLVRFLQRQGWAEDDVYAALGRYWQRVTGVSLPERSRAGGSSRDAFLYLLSFATLAAWSTALGSLLFAVINLWVRDATSRAGLYAPDFRLTVTWQMASIAVAFPIYLVVMRLIFREVAGNLERLESGVRKWLTWLALLITAGSMICDLVWFLNYFLTGELTLRFVLKCAVVFVLCGAIFAWYLGSLKWTAETPKDAIRTRGLRFAAGATAVVVVSFLVGLGLAGTPATQREYEADARRVQDLQSLATQFRYKTGNAQYLKDPETGRAYEYRALDGTNYELCATFKRPSSPDLNTIWTHGVGRSCFRLDSAKDAPY
jgi:hypothetical protein